MKVEWCSLQQGSTSAGRSPVALGIDVIAFGSFPRDREAHGQWTNDRQRVQLKDMAVRQRHRVPQA